jgi:hypothetical protein
MLFQFGPDAGADRFGIEDFVAVRVSNKYGWSLICSIQIPNQTDFYATIDSRTDKRSHLATRVFGPTCSRKPNDPA